MIVSAVLVVKDTHSEWTSYPHKTCLKNHNDVVKLFVSTEEACKAKCLEEESIYCCSAEFIMGFSCILSKDSGSSHPFDLENPCSSNADIYLYDRDSAGK